MPTPDEFGVENWEHVELKTPDGESLKCYFLEGRKGMDMGVTVRAPRLLPEL